MSGGHVSARPTSFIGWFENLGVFQHEDLKAEGCTLSSFSENIAVDADSETALLF